MPNEVSLCVAFGQFLVREKHYPEESIVTELPIASATRSTILRPDLAIVEPSRKEILAFVEVKERLSSSPSKELISHLRSYSRAIAGKVTPTYLVSTREAGGGFVIYSLSETNQLVEVPEEKFPEFSGLSAGIQAAKKDNLDKEQDQTVDAFRWLCWIAAVVTGVLFIADVVCSTQGYKLLTAERLAVLGVAVALLVIPTAAKLKILGLEYERYIDKQARESKRGSKAGTGREATRSRTGRPR